MTSFEMVDAADELPRELERCLMGAARRQARIGTTGRREFIQVLRLQVPRLQVSRLQVPRLQVPP